MINRVLGEKYRILSLLGEGGMGAVYKAEHTFLRRRVAIKVLRNTYASNKGVVMRFFREAQAASAIGHPNIIEIHDVCKEDDGTIYMVMELLRGKNLCDELEDLGAIEPERAAGIMLQVLSALHAAHKKGIIHRDLKPENVFLTTDPRGREDVKLLDFGIAKVLNMGGESKQITIPGAIIGTPCFIAPELIKGLTGPTEQTDIWAAGVMMYEMLSGRLPFNGQSRDEILESILFKDHTSLTETGGAPWELAKIVDKALSKNWNERYKNARSMIEDLQPFVDESEYAMSTIVAQNIRNSIIPMPPYGEIDQITGTRTRTTETVPIDTENGETDPTEKPEQESGLLGMSSTQLILVGGIVLICIILIIAMLLK